MFDLDDYPDLDNAYATVLGHAAFMQYNRDDLVSCATFCDMLRQAPQEAIIALQAELAEIALETDDHNEASGFLMLMMTLGGGLSETSPTNHDWNTGDGNFLSGRGEAREYFDAVPLDDLEKFIEWAIRIPGAERELAYKSILKARMIYGLRMQPDDRAGALRLHQIDIVADYMMTDLKSINTFGNFATHSLSIDFNVREQIPARLWESFCSRDKKEADTIIAKWWGPKSDLPHDFFIALEWQRAGLITIHRGKHYAKTIAEFILHTCEPGDAYDKFTPRNSHGIEALCIDPFLEYELYEALAQEQGYRWLNSDNIQKRVAYLNSLFDAGALSRPRILVALDHGIAKRWDAPLLESYLALREQLHG